jgi:hypothetical protein
MTTARREYFLLIAGLVLLVITGTGVYYIQHTPNRTQDMAEVTQLVTAFGGMEKSISLIGPATTTINAIQAGYGQLVTNQLLQQWRADPQHAAGRETSSPWPDHIEIDSITPQGAGYAVSGRVIMWTSAGPSGEVPVVLLVVRENNAWRIAAYQESKTPQN